ncbi:hypothetical protein ACQ4M3_09600 [Leptolyngbya sp. AN03gr2]|uniref:hypothetical protein n=1 Tax=Leptolyngbya sp. AN03gr2 TaxID=3423364 RepID=UPI003D312035
MSKEIQVTYLVSLKVAVGIAATERSPLGVSILSDGAINKETLQNVLYQAARDRIELGDVSDLQHYVRLGVIEYLE